MPLPFGTPGTGQLLSVCRDTTGADIVEGSSELLSNRWCEGNCLKSIHCVMLAS